LHACDGKINAFGVVMGKPDGNGLLGKRRDNIKMDLRELAWEGVSWVHF
jgi:hypothetical protein